MVLALFLFFVSTIVIVLAGTRLVKVCDELADRTGLGEAFMGAIFLGAITSLPGITASVTAALDGAASLALSNAYGGIAAQTLFIAIADIFYPKVNLEHAAASVENMLMGVIVVILVSLLIFAASIPGVSVWHIHPVSLLLPVAYVFLMRIVQQTRATPMWQARRTEDTHPDIPSKSNEHMSRSDLRKRWLKLSGMGLALVISGWLLTRSAEHLAEHWQLGHSLVGGLGIAVITSLPELVTAIAAVRLGSLTLAVGGILGGNAFDTLFAAMADIAYTKGSIYAFATSKETAIAALSLIMTGVLLVGLLHRQRRGPAGIGFESLGVILIYIIGMAVIFLRL